MSGEEAVQHVDTIVIGGGQAGLAVGYHLAKRAVPFLILEANQRIGDAWRNRWDSLRLFTPARYNALPGLRFPAPGDSFPKKDAMADYLESYAKHFRLPVQTGVRVDRLSRQGDRFVVIAGRRRFESRNAVVAMANYQVPRLPVFAKNLDPSIRQLHAHSYRSPSQLQAGGVLVVGVGNSGADIAIDVAGNHSTWLSGKESGSIPYRIESFMARFVFVRIMRFIGHHILSLRTSIGRKQRPKFLHRAAPIIRVKPQDFVAAGIQRVGRVVGVKAGLPLLEGDRTLDVKNVIWCTGFHPGFSWIDLPVFDGAGDPMHDRGVVAVAPGLYFLGLQFLYSMTSATVHGVGRDAEHISDAIACRMEVGAERVAIARRNHFSVIPTVVGAAQ
jgi:putative flavoprotein involved in K+ transport